MSETAMAGGSRSLGDIAGAPETSSRIATLTLAAFALAMFAVHTFQLLTFTLPSGQFRNFHLAFAIIIGFLALTEGLPNTAVKRRGLTWLAVALAIVVAVYIHLEYRALTEARSFLPNTADIVIGLLLLGLALILSGLQWGWTIPLIALIGLAYGLWGKYLPGEIFFHGGIAPKRLLAYTSIPYFQGLLGGLTSLSAGTIFMFMVFGGALKATGAIDFIIRIGFSVGRHSSAGPALVAVTSSGLMGTVSGSTVANVASTGALTIPLMKRYGFSPAFAGAVEAVASTGGQLMPPVMGLAAFLIVGMTGIAYTEVMIAAVAPALIYYAYLMLAVQLRADNLGLDARPGDDDATETVPLGRLVLQQWHLIVSIVALVWLLVTGMPAGIAALAAVGMLLSLDAMMVVIRGRGAAAAWRAAGERVLNGIIEGTRSGAAVATVIAVIGVLIEILTVTGFAQKLSFWMLELADGSLLSLSIIIALSCLVFGLGLPTSASYFIVALFGAPSLIELGVPVLAAHLFVFYFANLSSITPPVAVAALVGANIAKAKFFPTALQAVRLGLPGFLMPFLFLFEPQILGLKGTVIDQLIAVGQALLATMALNFAVEGRIFTRIGPALRLALTAIALGLVYWIWWVELLAMAGLFAIVAWNYTLRRPRRAN